MKFRKKSIWVASVLTILLVLTGCTPNQKAIFDASMKMQNVHSVQEHITMSFELSGSGFEPTIQQQVDSAAAMLNTAKLDLNVKTSSNEEKTVSKSQVEMNLAVQGLKVNMPYWVDMDLTGSTPKLMEIFKVPQIATASLPPQFAGKEYMVMNPYDTNNSGLGNMDMTRITEFSKSFQTKGVNFLTSYAQRFNPNIDVVRVPTNDGLDSTQKYTVRLNDAQFKEFLSYTVNSFTQDEEAMNLTKEFMDSMLEFSAAPDKAGSSIDFDQTQFNTIMNQLKDITLLGDKGLELNYTISDGYVIQESGMINFKVDLSQINKIMNNSIEQEDVAINAKGALNLIVHFNTDITGINSPVEIQFPDVNANNSFNYLDLIEKPLTSEEPVQATPVTPVTDSYTVEVGDTLGTIALNHYGSYADFTNIYKANLDIFKNSNNRLDVGMVLTLPTEGLLSPLSTENVKEVYTVQAGDTLGKIAAQIYGDGSLYTKIFEANKGRIADPNLIYEGQKIIIPN